MCRSIRVYTGNSASILSIELNAATLRFVIGSTNNKLSIMFVVEIMSLALATMVVATTTRKTSFKVKVLASNNQFTSYPIIDFYRTKKRNRDFHVGVWRQRGSKNTSPYTDSGYNHYCCSFHARDEKVESG